MINNNYIVVLDLETANGDPYNCVPLELAALVIEPRTLKRVPGATFETLIKPWCGWDHELISAKAMEVNGIDKDEVNQKGLDEKVAYSLFVKFLKEFTKGNKWKAPVMAGFNIEGFDRIILDRLAHKYGYIDKDNGQKVFNPRDTFDVMKMVLGWTENDVEPEKLSLSVVKQWFGIPEGISHRAMGDVEPTADILIRLLEFQRAVVKKNKPKFKGAFSRGK